MPSSRGFASDRRGVGRTPGCAGILPASTPACLRPAAGSPPSTCHERAGRGLRDPPGRQGPGPAASGVGHRRGAARVPDPRGLPGQGAVQGARGRAGGEPAHRVAGEGGGSVGAPRRGRLRRPRGLPHPPDGARPRPRRHRRGADRQPGGPPAPPDPAGPRPDAPNAAAAAGGRRGRAGQDHRDRHARPRADRPGRGGPGPGRRAGRTAGELAQRAGRLLPPHLRRARPRLPRLRRRDLGAVHAGHLLHRHPEAAAADAAPARRPPVGPRDLRRGAPPVAHAQRQEDQGPRRTTASPSPCATTAGTCCSSPPPRTRATPSSSGPSSSSSTTSCSRAPRRSPTTADC